ncbi:MAG TPA: FimV/HubP family polar landmark protein [Gammaproteobacteria bacterium]|nr:FimV/HubP family polar landmark protein [Gammaproteobacteria bacterium]
MSKKLKFVLACMIAVLPLAANALGLGEIKLNSALNQPLNADIPIVGAAADEIGSLHIKIASAEQFKQAGLPLADVLSQLRFEIVQGPNGTASVHITSREPMREPFLDFLADATWDNGELIREYTVFLNPPNFETTTQAAPAAATAVAQPATAAPVGTTAAPASAVTPTPASTPAVTPVPMAPKPAAQPTATSAVITPAVSAGNSSLGGNYGPIHRGETLSQIALNMRPQGVTLNQMMIAIYRANPEVFMHNINLMKAGYVLRVPTLDDIQAVKVSEANSEVRTQIADWRASRGLTGAHKPAGNTEQPSLQLVAPSSAAQTTENQVPGVGKSAVGATTGANATGAAEAQATGTGAASTASNAPIAVASNSMSAVQAKASEQNKQAAETKTTPLNPEKPAAVKSLPKTRITPVQSTATSGGLLDSLLNPYVIIAIIVIILVLIAGIYIKKRRAADEAISKPVKIRKAPTADADWGKEEKAGLKDVTNLDSVDGSDAGGSASEAAMGTTASHMTTTNLKLDESDPMAEADFHMAYGLYDQAADVLNKALRQDPSRRDLKMKLLEVYFTAGDHTNFVETARGLRQEMGALPDKDWENIAIMGRQVAPEETLFSGEGAAAGASVDIPLDSGGTGTAVHTDLDPLAGAFEGMRPVTMPTTAVKPAPADQQVVDFSLPDIEPIAKSKKAATSASATTADSASGGKKPAPASGKKIGESTVTADFGTDSQVEFDKALKELSDFVNTNVPPQEEGTRGDSGQSMSLAADAEVPGTQTGISTGTGEETTGLNEIGTKLDLARAYIDMGDSDGAKNILQEVLEEGDSQQQQEARKLLQSLT